jgi:N-acetyl-1-D-myo-inositol-2-amino-2-deoxy-alpha-D-glucopyranoside deacetylase
VTTAAFEHVLFVHAHPDDETITTGGTIALLRERGAGVTVLTCTRGERGEVVPPELAHLSGDALAEHRAGELAEALRILGVDDQRFLGAADARMAGLPPRRYRDSGMRWGASGPIPVEDADPWSLSAADLREVAGDVATVIAEVRPTAVVSYDEQGGYGHPDHLVAQAAARHAALVLRVPYFSIVADGAGPAADRRVAVGPMLDKKTDALRAHRTQLTVVGDTIVHSGGQSEPIATVETFRHAGEDPGPEPGWEELRPASRLLACAGALAAGVVLGLVGSVNHQLVATPFGIPVWTGAAAALALAVLLLAGARLLTGNRVLAACAAVGLLLVVGILALPGPGGSVLIPANGPGWLWAYGPLVVAAVVLAWPRPRIRTPATMGGAEPVKEGNAS